MLGGIGSLTLVANTIFAPLIAEEVLTWTHVWATVCIIMGCSMVVAYGPHSSEVYSARQLFDMLASPGFVLYIAFMAAAGFYLHNALTNISRAVESSIPAASSGPVFEGEAIRRAAVEARLARDVEAGDAGLPAPLHRTAAPPAVPLRRGRARGHVPAARRAGGRGQPPYVETESGMILDYSKSRRPWTSYHIHRTGFAVMSAIFGALNVLFAKLLSQVMASAVLSASAFYEEASLASSMAVVVLFCIILIAVATVGQMKYINDATQRFEALLVQPIYQASWTLLSVTGGMVVQREWVLFTDYHKGALFFFGIFCTLSGAFLLSTVRASGVDSSARAVSGGRATREHQRARASKSARRLAGEELEGRWDEEAAAARQLLRDRADEAVLGGVGEVGELTEEPLEGVFGAGGLCDGAARVGGARGSETGRFAAAELVREASDGALGVEEGLLERQGLLSTGGNSSYSGQTQMERDRRSSEAETYDDGAGGIGSSSDTNSIGGAGSLARQARLPEDVDGPLAGDGGTGGLRVRG